MATRQGARDAFASALTQLWTAAGNPTLERVSARSNVSVQRLSDWRNGRRVPDRIDSVRPVLEVLIAAAKERTPEPPADGLYDLHRWVRAWQAASAARTVPVAAQCPYRGLAPFRAEDARSYFGRERSLAELLDRLVDDSGVHVLIGASGAGKSSLLQAGLLNSVTNGLGPTGKWTARYLTPGADPLASLAAVDVLDADEQMLIVVDQFEETFTAAVSDADRREFVARVAALCGPRRRVVLGLRADFYSTCLQYPELADALQYRQMVLGPMTEDELRSAITEPAAAAGLRLENGLVDLILSDLAVTSGVLPLLSHVLEVAWRRRDKDRITIAAYRGAGGVRGSVAATAEQAWTDLADTGRAVAPEVLLRLVQVGDDTRDTRRHIAKSELLRGLDPIAAESVFEELTAARLVTVEDSGVVTLTHEIVIESWPRLREWIDVDREGNLFRQRLERDARDWDSQGRPRELLWQGARLADAQRRVGTGDEVVTDFFSAAAARRRVRRLAVAGALTTVIVLAVTAVIFGAVAVRANDSLASSRDDAVYRSILTDADRVQLSDPSLAAQLYLVADRMRPGDATVDTKLLSTGTAPLATSVVEHTGDVYIVAYSPDGRTLATGSDDKSIKLWDVADPAHPQPIATLTGHTNYVDGLSWSPDGRTLASASGDMTIRLWDVSDLTRPSPIGLPFGTGPGTVYGVVFSPDGNTIAASLDNHTVELWNVSDREHPVRRGEPLRGHNGAVRTIAYSPDGTLIASGSDDRTVQLWDVSDPDRPVPAGPPIGGFRLSAHAVVFGPDSAVLAAAGDDGMLRLFDISDRAAPRLLGDPITAHAAAIWHIAISPDGHTLATAGWDGSAKLWNIDDPARPVLLGQPLTGSNGGVITVAWSPDAQTLAAGSKEGAIWFWNLAPGVVGAHSDRTAISGFDESGDLLASGSVDASVQIWRVDGQRLRRLGRIAVPPQVNSVAINPAGTLLAVANSIDSTVRLLDITDPERPNVASELHLDNRYTIPVSFSPDGTRLATAGDDHSVQLWDVSKASEPRALGDPLKVSGTGLVTSIDFDSSGSKLVAVSNDRVLRLWDVTGAPRMIGDVTDAHTRAINSVAFAPDGETLATAGDDKAIRLWDVSDTGLRQIGDPILGHRALIRSVAWSPDGRRLATGSEDQTVRLWDVSDVDNPAAVGTSLAQAGTANWTVAFGPASDRLVAGGARGALRIWSLDVDVAIERICDTTATLWTEELWDEHIPDLPYDPPCD